MSDEFFGKQADLILDLFVAQIYMSITEGDKSVNTLTDAFVNLVDDIKVILAEFKNSISEQSIDNIQKGIDSVSKDICNRINSSTIAFQFYDRLSQRLNHVADGLTGISGAIKNKEQLLDSSFWERLRTEIREKYSMEAERMVFDSIINGKSIKEALSLYANDNSSQQGEVELF